MEKHTCKPEKKHPITIILVNAGKALSIRCGKTKIPKGQKIFARLLVDTTAGPEDIRGQIWDSVLKDEEVSELTRSLRIYKALCQRMGVFERDNDWDPYQYTAFKPAPEKDFIQLVAAVSDAIGTDAGREQAKAFSKEGRAEWDKQGSRAKSTRPEPKLEKLSPLKVPKADKPATAEEMAARTVALVLTFSGIGNRRKIAASQIEVEADKEWINATKKLVDAKELQAIQSLDGECRRYVESRALPSMLKKGVYLLPIELVEPVTDRLREFEAERAKLVENLLAVYSTLIEDAKKRLKKLFNAADYPTQAYLRQAFQLSWQIINFSTPASLKEISDRIYREQLAKSQSMWDNARDTVQQLLRASMAEMVQHLVDKLTPTDGKPKVFRDSAVTKMEEFFSTFDARNITNDAQLKTLVERGRSLLKGVDADMLRQSENVRDYVRKGFAEVAQAIEPMIVDRPKRKITFEEV